MLEAKNRFMIISIILEILHKYINVKLLNLPSQVFVVTRVKYKLKGIKTKNNQIVINKQKSIKGKIMN